MHTKFKANTDLLALDDKKKRYYLVHAMMVINARVVKRVSKSESERAKLYTQKSERYVAFFLREDLTPEEEILRKIRVEAALVRHIEFLDSHPNASSLRKQLCAILD